MNKRKPKAPERVPPPEVRTLRLAADGNVSGDIVEQIEQRFAEQLARARCVEVVLDLTRTNALDSRAISVCIGVFRECQAASRSFCIEANPTIYRMLTMINLHKAMTIREVAV
jgi:anti-anti-sigma factor